MSKLFKLSAISFAVLVFTALFATSVSATTPLEIGLINSSGSGYTDPIWIANTDTSSWVVYAKGTCAQLQWKIYNYSRTFSLSQKANVVIFGRYAVDDVLLSTTVNGYNVGISGSGFTNWTNFTMTIPADKTNVGTNTIVFTLQDTTCNITGFRVEFTSVQLSPQNIICSTNSQCGTNGFTGSPFCQGNSVYRNYITYICNNPGTANSSCTSSTVAQLQNTCASNQTCVSGYCSANQQNYITVQTNPATNVFNNQAVLNGWISGINVSNTKYVWFQWGLTTSYGFETNRQTINYAGPFSQNVIGLSPGFVYHFRAVAQDNNNQIVYGQNMTFQLGQVLGATNVATGLTNNFLIDSFFLPLIIALIGIWLFKSKILSFTEWVDSRKIKHRNYIVGKKLKSKIAEIKEKENC